MERPWLVNLRAVFHSQPEGVCLLICGEVRSGVWATEVWSWTIAGIIALIGAGSPAAALASVRWGRAYKRKAGPKPGGAGAAGLQKKEHKKRVWRTTPCNEFENEIIEWVLH